MSNIVNNIFSEPTTKRRLQAIVLVFIILFVHRCLDFVGVRYTMADDIDYSLLSFYSVQGVSAIDLAFKSAIFQGRLGHIFGIPFAAFMNNLGSQLIYDTINMSAFFLTVAAIFTMLWRHYGVGFSVLAATLFFALFPQLWDHAPPSAQPLWFIMPILFFFIFHYFILRYANTASIKHQILFSIFFFLSLLQYELFVVLFTPLATFLAWHLSRTQASPRRFLLNTLAPIFSVAALYLLLYVLFKHYFPATYSGTTIGSLSPIKIASSIYHLTIGSFSPYYLLKGQYEIFYFDLDHATRTSLIPPFNLLDILTGTSILDWVIAVFSVVVAATCLREASSRIRNATLLAAAGIGLFIAFSSLLLYAVSPTYQSLVAQGTVFYVGSRYAYTGWIIVFAALVTLAARAVPIGRSPLPIALIPYVAISALVFIGSINSSHLNERVAQTMRVHASKWQAVAAAIKCGPVATALQNKPVLAPILWNRAWYAHIRPEDYWRRYTALHYNKPIAFQDKSDSTSDNVTTYFTYRMDQHGDVFAIVVAEGVRGGQASALRILTPRDSMVRIAYPGASGYTEKQLRWGPGLVICGEYLLSNVTDQSIPLDSVIYEKTPYATMP